MISANATKGFSLVEVVVALGIASFALVAIFALLPVAYTASTDSTGDNQASLIAQDITSRVSTLLAKDDPLLAAPINYYYDSDGRLSDDPATQQYLATVAVEPLLPAEYTRLNTTSSHLVSATIQVRWPVINGVVPPKSPKQQRPVRFTVYLAKE